MNAEVNGWKPPLIYDVGIDGKRIATQEDVDTLVLIAREYGRIISEMRKFVNYAEFNTGQSKSTCADAKVC